MGLSYDDLNKEMSRGKGSGTSAHKWEPILQVIPLHQGTHGRGKCPNTLGVSFKTNSSKSLSRGTADKPCFSHRFPCC